jgi:MazG family protein
MTINLQTLMDVEKREGIEKLVRVIEHLRHPEHGCPWDLKQTHTSLKPHLLEESYECLEAIDSGKPDLIQEELGDVLLQVVLHAQLAKDAGTFDFDAVAQGIADKLVRRHPHVFGDVQVDSAEAVTRNWQAIKAQEKQAKQAQNQDEAPEVESVLKQESILKEVKRGQPALSRALDTSKRAVKVGFEWPDFKSLWDCVMSEYDEFRAEVDSGGSYERLEEELGDILFASVNLARQFKIDPEIALTKATDKFTRRFQRMEVLAEKRKKPLENLDFQAWDDLWNQAKKETAKQDTTSRH